MMRIAIHSKVSLSQVQADDFSHMISIGDVGCDMSGLRLSNISSDQHLCLNFRDRKTPDRKDSPTEDDIRPLFCWLDSAGEISGLLIHCGAGMSRSPSIALLALCYLDPKLSPFDAMQTVQEFSNSNYIWPNPLVVELGDRLLQRQGKIVEGADRWRKLVEPG